MTQVKWVVLLRVIISRHIKREEIRSHQIIPSNNFKTSSLVPKTKTRLISNYHQIRTNKIRDYKSKYMGYSRGVLMGRCRCLRRLLILLLLIGEDGDWNACAVWWSSTEPTTLFVFVYVYYLFDLIYGDRLWRCRKDNWKLMCKWCRAWRSKMKHGMKSSEENI